MANWVFAQTTCVVARIEIWFCMVDVLWEIVLNFNLDQISSVVIKILWVKIWVPALLWPMAYTVLYYHTGVTIILIVQYTAIAVSVLLITVVE